MKTFDSALLFGVLTALVGACIPIIIAVCDSKKSRNDKIKIICYSSAVFLIVMGILFGCAYCFNAESDILNLHPKLDDKTNRDSSFNNNHTEAAVFGNTEEPVKPIYTYNPLIIPEATQMMDYYGLPAAWFSDSEHMSLSLFAESFNSSYEPLHCDNHISFLLSKSFSDIQVGENQMIIDSARFYKAFSLDVPQMVSSHPAWDNGKFNAVYCEYHFDKPFGVPFGVTCGGCELFDSNGKSIEILNQYSNPENGCFVVFIPNDLDSGDYLIEYYVATAVGKSEIAVYVSAFFLLNLE